MARYDLDRIRRGTAVRSQCSMGGLPPARLRPPSHSRSVPVAFRAASPRFPQAKPPRCLQARPPRFPQATSPTREAARLREAAYRLLLRTVQSLLQRTRRTLRSRRPSAPRSVPASLGSSELWRVRLDLLRLNQRCRGSGRRWPVAWAVRKKGGGEEGSPSPWPAVDPRACAALGSRAFSQKLRPNYSGGLYPNQAAGSYPRLGASQRSISSTVIFFRFA